jgi:tRNA threonylcarbamoyladenosine biosynthesis protein TsaE
MLVEFPDLEATSAFGRRLGALLFPGAVIALVGELGAGKTHLTRAIAEGLGVRDGRIVTSPTFVLLQEYQGRVPIWHFDAYRLQGESEFIELGAQELFDTGGVSIIEWADRVSSYLPQEHLRITLTICSETAREAALEAQGERYVAVLEALC